MAQYCAILGYITVDEVYRFLLALALVAGPMAQAQDCIFSSLRDLIIESDRAQAPLDDLWEQYLEDALGKNGRKLGKRAFSLPVKVEGLEFSVVIKFDANGKLKQVGVDQETQQKLQQMGIRLLQVTEGEGSYWKLSRTDAVDGDEILLMAFVAEKAPKGEGQIKGRLAIYVGAP